MLQVKFSLTLIKIWNLQCVVLPPEINKTIISLEATIKTIFPLDINVKEITLQRKVLLVPPKP